MEVRSNIAIINAKIPRYFFIHTPLFFIYYVS